MLDKPFLDIESLSKTALENYVPTENGPSWELIENRLNDEMPLKEKKRFFFWIFNFFLVLLAGVIVFVTLQFVNDRQGKTDAISLNSVVKLPKKENQNSDAKITYNRPVQQTTPPKKSPKSTLLSSLSLIQPTKASNFFKPNSTENTLIKNIIKNQQFTSANTSTTTLNNPPAVIEKIFKEDSSNITSQQQIWKEDVLTTEKELIKNDTIKQNEIPINQKQTTKKRPIPLSFAVYYGADFTLTNKIILQSISHNYGLLLQYRFNNWAINTGVLSTKKEYKSTDPNFSFDANLLGITNTNGLKLQQVLGHSHILEIPLQIGYYFPAKQKNKSYFINAGVSAYIMENERFNYTFLQNGNSFTTSVDYSQHDERNDDYFGWVLHFSGGIKKQLPSGNFWQIEPFIKIPVSSMGIGNIRLTSIGLSTSFYFTPFHKK